jgi:hypothetical protein
MAQVPARRAGVSSEIVRAARRQRSIRLYNARKEQWRFRFRRLRRAFLAMAGIYIAALVAALVLGGIAFVPTLLTMLLGVAVFAVLAIYPATPRTHVEDLNTATLPELAGATELWLEGKRRALPNAAVDTIDFIGVRLEQIAPQLATLDERGPAAHEVRKLLTEHLPGMVESYTRIPASLRARRGTSGATPSEQLVDGLAVIADQIEAMSTDLSQGDIDALPTRGRYLETRYVDP